MIIPIGMTQLNVTMGLIQKSTHMLDYVQHTTIQKQLKNK